LAAGVDRVITVVRSGAGRLAELLSAEGVEVLVCSDADQGMGISLACGVRSAPEAEGWLVALADMPFIRPATVRQIAALIRRGTDLAVPIYQGRRGHPVGFSRMFGRLLSQLEGDIGARQILHSYAEHLTLLPCDDPGVLLDIDVPGDLAASNSPP
jgi:molybdenum cofactor cytidylyltransferase